MGRRDRKQPSAGLENQFRTVIKYLTGPLCRFLSLSGGNASLTPPKNPEQINANIITFPRIRIPL